LAICPQPKADDIWDVVLFSSVSWDHRTFEFIPSVNVHDRGLPQMWLVTTSHQEEEALLQNTKIQEYLDSNVEGSML